MLQTQLSRITEAARNGKGVKVKNVQYLLGQEENLVECFEELKRGRVPGVDGVSVEAYGHALHENLRGLIRRMQSWSYHPQPVKRAYIPKANGTRRPLGIPATEDKVVQAGMTRILEAVYEPEFAGCSFGFRKGRGCHQALRALNDMIYYHPVQWVIDVDLERFFDTVAHEWLMKFVGHRIGDWNFLRMLKRILRSGVMEEQRYEETTVGTPQGGIISPVLANIYLHYVLDLWFEKVVKKECRGYAGMVRYADDFVVCVEHESDAVSIRERLQIRLAKFGLKMSAAKTRVIKFGRGTGAQDTFNFLGFTHYNARSRKGGYKVGRKTEKGRFVRALQSLNIWLRKVRSAGSILKWWPILLSKIMGHYRYYGVSDNYRGLQRFFHEAQRLILKWMNRRSQKRKMSWTTITAYFKRYPLPTPRIYQDFYGFCTNG